MNYFSKIIFIRYACGHRGKGTDTYQSFVTQNQVSCPRCSRGAT